MSIYAFIGMVAGVVIWLFGRWREKRALLGIVPMVPHFYIQLTGLIVFLVFAADFIAAVTGVTWTSPFRR